MSEFIEIMSPIAPIRAGDHPLAPRPPGLAGLRVGFLHNNKPNGEVILARVEELLRQAEELAACVRWQKENPTVPEERIGELASRVDLVVNAIGD